MDPKPAPNAQKNAEKPHLREALEKIGISNITRKRLGMVQIVAA